MIQVKSTHVNTSIGKGLKGVLERENTAVGLFMTLEEPAEPMKQEAIAAGFYTPELCPNLHYPRTQILTIKEFLEGKEPD